MVRISANDCTCTSSYTYVSANKLHIFAQDSKDARPYYLFNGWICLHGVLD